MSPGCYDCHSWSGCRVCGDSPGQSGRHPLDLTIPVALLASSIRMSADGGLLTLFQ